MSEANKALVQRYYREVLGDQAAIAEVVAASFVDHHFTPGLPAGPEGVRQYFKAMRGVFSDMKIEIGFMLAEGDKVDCHFTFVAKHTGELLGIKPKGNLIRLPAISTFRIQGVKLAEGWEIVDSGILFEQMKA
jgi:predicted ester cyclase